eukprot:1351101-Prymnesium_polylepis.1
MSAREFHAAGVAWSARRGRPAVEESPLDALKRGSSSSTCTCQGPRTHRTRIPPHTLGRGGRARIPPTRPPGEEAAPEGGPDPRGPREWSAHRFGGRVVLQPVLKLDAHAAAARVAQPAATRARGGRVTGLGLTSRVDIQPGSLPHRSFVGHAGRPTQRRPRLSAHTTQRARRASAGSAKLHGAAGVGAQFARVRLAVAPLGHGALARTQLAACGGERGERGVAFRDQLSLRLAARRVAPTDEHLAVRVALQHGALAPEGSGRAGSREDGLAEEARAAARTTRRALAG